MLLPHEMVFYSIIDDLQLCHTPSRSGCSSVYSPLQLNHQNLVPHTDLLICATILTWFCLTVCLSINTSNGKQSSGQQLDTSFMFYKLYQTNAFMVCPLCPKFIVSLFKGYTLAKQNYNSRWTIAPNHVFLHIHLYFIATKYDCNKALVEYIDN